MTCLDGYSFHAGDQGLVESLLRVANKGIVAGFSPTGLGVATGHDWLQRGFYDSIFEDGLWGLGEAALSARLNLFLTGTDSDLIQTFTVFGDPALQIHNPYGIPQVTPASAVDAGTAGSIVTYSIQVTNRGLVSDRFAASVSGNLWQVTAPATAPVQPNSTSTLYASVQIPPGAVIGAEHLANVHIYSLGDVNKFTTVELTTRVGDITISPSSSFIRTSPGLTVYHPYTITNAGPWQDSYSITILNKEWSTGASPVNFTLAPGAGRAVTVNVYIPPNSNISFDISQLRVQSSNYPGLWKEAGIITTIADLLYLPGLFR